MWKGAPAAFTSPQIDVTNRHVRYSEGLGPVMLLLNHTLGACDVERNISYGRKLASRL